MSPLLWSQASSPHPVPCCTPGVSLRGSWCKALLINLPKLVCVCVRVCASVPKHTLQAAETGHHEKQASQTLGWSVSDAWRERAKERAAQNKKKTRNETRCGGKENTQSKSLKKMLYSALTCSFCVYSLLLLHAAHFNTLTIYYT